MLSLEVDSVDISDVDAYAESRGRSTWTDAPVSPPEDKLAAIRRATDYLAATYNDRWLDEFEADDVPTAVKFAIAEAAIRELEEAGALAPDLDPNGRIQSIEAGSVSITYADGATPVTVFRSLDNLLIAGGMIKARSSTTTTFTKRA